MLNPFMCQCILHHILYTSQIAYCRVVGARLLHAQEMLEVVEYARSHVLNWNVRSVETCFEEFLHIVGTTTPTLISGFHNIATFILLFAYLVCITEHLYHHLWLLSVTEKQRLQNSRVDRLVFSDEHIVNITKFGAHQFKVLVQFKVTARATTA